MKFWLIRSLVARWIFSRYLGKWVNYKSCFYPRRATKELFSMNNKKWWKKLCQLKCWNVPIHILKNLEHVYYSTEMTYCIPTVLASELTDCWNDKLGEIKVFSQPALWSNSKAKRKVSRSYSTEKIIELRIGTYISFNTKCNAFLSKNTNWQISGIHTGHKYLLVTNVFGVNSSLLLR